ncbi:unnamed protein product [Chondrus crispus]|uniref:Uncharacterized protein n=1 Tax=Chondrus crispus TaxID=2769 RepID=R7QPC3_CHOCR|nr:unnamed protein product [Chondrus crispus]CDF40342.1 unnamed protein product [Chondrus crispus]|eukprot:XP_005710636.1 unnamed protein product [Chondrus crispus]
MIQHVSKTKPTQSQPEPDSQSNHAFLNLRVIPSSKHCVLQPFRLRFDSHPTAETSTVHLHHRLCTPHQVAIFAHSHCLSVEHDHMTTCGTAVILITQNARYSMLAKDELIFGKMIEGSSVYANVTNNFETFILSSLL